MSTLPCPVSSGLAPGLIWRNSIFAGPHLRRAHVEILTVPGCFAVLHVCLLPWLDDPTPIFGFDVVGGAARATGVFLDLSPVTPGRPALCLGDVLTPQTRRALGAPRDRPDWGDIFSDDFLAVRPLDTRDLRAGIAAGLDVLDIYCGAFAPRDRPPDPQAYHMAVLAGHSAYTRAQRRNPHTRRLLAKYVGGEAADAFIRDILFPDPP